MANHRCLKLALNVAFSANRFRLVIEEAQVTVMAALAIRPQEARTRDWEAQIPGDVDAPMRGLDEVFAQMRPQGALSRGQQARDLMPPLPLS